MKSRARGHSASTCRPALPLHSRGHLGGAAAGRPPPGGKATSPAPNLSGPARGGGDSRAPAPPGQLPAGQNHCDRPPLPSRGHHPGPDSRGPRRPAQRWGGRAWRREPWAGLAGHGRLTGRPVRRTGNGLTGETQAGDLIAARPGRAQRPPGSAGAPRLSLSPQASATSCLSRSPGPSPGQRLLWAPTPTGLKTGLKTPPPGDGPWSLATRQVAWERVTLLTWPPGTDGHNDGPRWWRDRGDVSREPGTAHGPFQVARVAEASLPPAADFPTQCAHSAWPAWPRCVHLLPHLPVQMPGRGRARPWLQACLGSAGLRSLSTHRWPGQASRAPEPQPQPLHL